MQQCILEREDELMESATAVVMTSFLTVKVMSIFYRYKFTLMVFILQAKLSKKSFFLKEDKERKHVDFRKRFIFPSDNRFAQ